MISFNENWESVIKWFFSISGKATKSSPSLPAMLNFAFSHLISALLLLSVSMVTSLSGSFLIISENNFASKAIHPLSSTSPSMVVSIPRSISLAVNLMTPEVVSISMHSRIGIVVLAGTAFNTVFTPVSNADLLQMIFICWYVLSYVLYKGDVIHKS